MQSPVPLVKRTSVLTYRSLGFSLGYFLVDALMVTWFMPAVRPSLPLTPCPDDIVRRYLVYLKYWTLNLRPLMVYPKVLFPPDIIIKDTLQPNLGTRLKWPSGSAVGRSPQQWSWVTRLKSFKNSQYRKGLVPRVFRSPLELTRMLELRNPLNRAQVWTDASRMGNAPGPGLTQNQ